MTNGEFGDLMDFLMDNYGIPARLAEIHAERIRDRFIEPDAPVAFRYSPRGIGLNYLPCGICGAHTEYAQPDMSAYVKDRLEGEAVVALFEKANIKAVLDYREYEPKYVQVKVGACEEHKYFLENLHNLTASDRMIDLRIINDAKRKRIR